MPTSAPWLDVEGFKSRSVMPPEDVDNLTRISCMHADDREASDPTPESPIGVSRAAANILWATITPTDSLIASDTNYATIVIQKRTNGGTPSEIATLTTKTMGGGGSGNWGAGVPIAFVVDNPAVLLSDLLTYEISKTGTGVVVPCARIEMLPSVTLFDQFMTDRQSWIEDRLRKRYAIPFATPFPSDVLRWLTALVTFDMYARRGFNPTSAQDQEAIIQAMKDAKAEVLEASDAVAGQFDLPLRADLSSSSGIVKGGPFGYSEQSPYVPMTRQANQGRYEDRNGSGKFTGGNGNR